MFFQDTEKAERHLETAARQNTYGASIDLIRLRYRQNKEYDVLKSLEAVLEQYIELERRCQTLAQIGSYYLFKNRDLLIAVEYYLKIMNEYPQCEAMKVNMCIHSVSIIFLCFKHNSQLLTNNKIIKCLHWTKASSIELIYPVSIGSKDTSMSYYLSLKCEHRINSDFSNNKETIEFYNKMLLV